MHELSQVESARAFARSLNILLKYVRLYGMDHQRTQDQFDIAWEELKRAAAPETGLLLGAADGKLVIDGLPLEGNSERSFANLLTTANIASLNFTYGIQRIDLEQLLRAFHCCKPSEVGQQLKAALGDHGAIRVNEVRFVPGSEDLAEQLATRTLADRADNLAPWLQDPEKLLQLIAAAEGSSGGGSGEGTGGDGGNAGGNGEGSGGSGAAGTGTGGGFGAGSGVGNVFGGTGTGGAGSGTGGGAGSGSGGSGGEILQEEAVTKTLRLLATVASLRGKADPESALMRELSQEKDACRMLRKVMLLLPVEGEDEGLGTDTLKKLAERLAIRFAMQQFERGNVKVNAVHDMMERMGKEIESLRSVLESHESKMTRAGMAVESYADLLDRKFWANIPEQGKKSVLLSPDMWCIPARNIRAYIEELISRGDLTVADEILRNCLRQLGNSELEARRKTAVAINELADLFGKVAPGLLVEAVRQVGMRVCAEAALEMQTLLGAAYVRLTQEAAQQRDYPAVFQSLVTLERLHEYRPRTAQEVRPRITMDNRLRGFISEAIQAPVIPEGLVSVLARTPQLAAQELALQFGQCTLRSQANRVVELAESVGKGVVECLTGGLRAGHAGEVSGTAGLLSRLRPEVVDEVLPGRVGSFSRPQQDAVVRALAAAGAPQRGRLLLEILQQLDPLVLPETLDEIGFSGESAAAGKLMELAAGEGLAKDRPLIRIKAIEALGRLGISDATTLLDEIMASRGLFASRRSREMQLTAARALVNINPDRLPSLCGRAGFGPQELAVGALAPSHSDWVRQRRYPRVQPLKPWSALAITPKGKCAIDVQRLSLGGGLISADPRLPRGGEAVLEWQVGLSRLRTHVLLRHLLTREIAFEVLDIDMDGRSRLRRMVMDHAPAALGIAAGTTGSTST
jgi:RNase P/RNase MRP subunit POP5